MPLALLAPLVALLALGGCTGPAEPPTGSATSKSTATQSAGTPRMPGARREHDRAKHGLSLTAEQRIALLKARQAEASEEYAVRYAAAGSTKSRRGSAPRPAYQASNPARSNRAEFFDEGARVARATDEPNSGLDVRLVRWGRENTLAAPAPALAPKARGNRVSYARGRGLTEWYLNGPAGVEQGFTLGERPPGPGELVFEVALEGLGVTPQLTRDGRAVELMTSPQVSIGRYGDLYAEDASGRVVPATMSVVGGKVELRVDDSDAQYPLIVDPTVWLVEAKLLAALPDGTPDGEELDYFGSSVAVSGDTMVVGAFLDDDQGATSGSVYVFVRSGTSWTVQQKLLAQLPDGTLDGAADHCFGESVSVSGDTLVVGAYGGDDQGEHSGSAYVFVRSGSTWIVQQKLLAQLPDGTPDGEEGDRFGFSVSASGDTLVVGADGDDDQGRFSGSAYVFVRSASTWTVQQKLLAQLPDGTPDGEEGDYFGESVSVSGDTLVVGAYGDDDQGESSGSAYVFVRSASTWTVQQKLLAQLPDGTPDGAADDRFADLVSVSGDTLVVGAYGDDDQGESSGSAYVFVRSGPSWTPQQKLLAALPDGTPDGAVGDSFGIRVSVSGDTVVVGANGNDDQGEFSGSVYVFVRSGSSWTPQQKLLAALPDGTPDGAASDEFGRFVSVSGDTIVAGAYNDAPGGSAYVFRASESPGGSPCSADFICESGSCLGRVCCAAACEGPCRSCAAADTGEADGVCAPLAAGTVCGADPRACTSDASQGRAPECDGAGECVAVSADCAPGFACLTGEDGGACVTDCQSIPDHGGCTHDFWCQADGTCAPDFGSGDACTLDAQCPSDVCADGVCCNEPCDGLCESCIEPGSVGECTPLAEGELPRQSHGTCEADMEACDGACDGASRHACAYPEGRACGEASCSAARITGQLCTASGQCVEDSTARCPGSLTCASPTACLDECANDDDCVTGSECDGATGECRGVLNQGEPCETYGQCKSGHCADGVCCNTECNLQCEACAEAGSEGTCTAVVGEPRGARGACGGGGTSCGGECNGSMRDGCFFPDAGTECAPASCTGVTLTRARTCDGAGRCQAAESESCAPYACDSEAAECLTQCQDSEDCASGASCALAEGECVAVSTSCIDAYTVESADGTTTDCRPYECQAGACRESCDDPTNCTEGYECQEDDCVEVVPSDEGSGNGGSGGTGDAAAGGAGDALTGGTAGTARTGEAAGVGNGGSGAAGNGAAGGAGDPEQGGTAGTPGAAGTSEAAEASGSEETAGSAGTAGAAGHAGASLHEGAKDDGGGCGCVAAGRAPSRGGLLAGAVVLGCLLPLVRRRRQRREC